MEVKPLAGLTEGLRVLLKFDIAITAVAVFAGFYDYYSYANLPSSVDPNAIFLLSDDLNLMVAIVQLFFFILVGFVFLWWIYRTNNNLHTLSSEQMTFTPGWSVGWYFVPIANLFKPYQAMKEIWRICHKNESTNYSLLGWWWFLWILIFFLCFIQIIMVFRIEDLDSYKALSMISIGYNGLGLILDIVALMLVTRVGLAYSRNII